jgi:hypothetical protein
MLLGPLESANLDITGLDKVQKLNDSECYTPLSDPNRILCLHIVL